MPFALCELEWMRVELVARLECASLSKLVAQLRDGVSVEVDDAEIQHVHAAIETAAEFIGWAVMLARCLTPTTADICAVETAAVAALGAGIASGDRARHAASWIPAQAGATALARALATDDAHQFWSLPVECLLASFRDASPAWAAGVVRAAGVKRTTFAELPVDRLGALRAELLRANSSR